MELALSVFATWIDRAFEREKQIQGWRREKKEALVNGKRDQLPALAKRRVKGWGIR